MTTRVGVVADTHCPEFIERLPEKLFGALRGVDLILHAGDVNGPQVIEELRRIAPVETVRGDHDRELRDLPLARELHIEGRRIVLVHGNQSRWVEEPSTLLWTLTLGYLTPHTGLTHALHRTFNGADAIVFGHLHRPVIQVHDGTLLFNPGGVHVWNPETAAARLRQDPGWFEWFWLQLARHLRRHSPPSVGILEVSRSAIVPTIIPL